MPDDPQNEIIEEIAPGDKEIGLGVEPEVAQNPFVEAITNDGAEQTAALSANIDGATGPDTEIDTAFAIDDKELEGEQSPDEIAAISPDKDEQITDDLAIGSGESVAVIAAISEDEAVAALDSDDDLVIAGDAPEVPEQEAPAPEVPRPYVRTDDYSVITASTAEGDKKLAQSERENLKEDLAKEARESAGTMFAMDDVNPADTFAPSQVPANNVPQRQSGFAMIPD